MGQVVGRLAACIFMMNRPVIENSSAATAKMSMNQLHAVSYTHLTLPTIYSV